MPAVHPQNAPSFAVTVQAPPRSKQPRADSPGPSGSNHDSRPPPTKRARKAINCEPCRNSKLKCDRNRPCSSCVLRGTTASCYQGQDTDNPSKQDEVNSQTRVDPAAELSRIRSSLSLLESHIYQNVGGQRGVRPPSPQSSKRGPSYPPAPTITGGHDSSDSGFDSIRAPGSSKDKPDVPGMRGHQGNGGFYAGPTSTLNHLLSATTDRDETSSSDGVGVGTDPSTRDSGLGPHAGAKTKGQVPPPVYDEDLVPLLPPIHIVDGLIEYYFEYCNWIYRTVNEPAFMTGWAAFKSGANGDRIVLCTVCILIALTVRYLPPGHALLLSLQGTVEDIGSRYYGVMLEALHRYREATRKEGQGKGYTLALVEMLLVRCHYLTYAKEDPEDTWSCRGELISIGTAMGLHRDPGKSKYDRIVAERRRWAWWHIILLERWQAFMFGRPLAIASHHFNTRLPSYCDPELDKSGRLYLPNIALFKLAYVLGGIMEDAVSFRAVSYASIQDSDKLLVQWMDELPPELDLDEYRLARSLASPVTSVRRLGVQSVIIRGAYHHIRCTMHRPYAKLPFSLETAVNSASQIITLISQARPDFLSNSALAVPGHMNWGPFHIFSAAMFFSFQLITTPDQPAASLFRENIRKSIATLERSQWMPVADQALTILRALAPLYSDDFANESKEEQELKKSQVLNLVKTLAFPYQEGTSVRTGESPAVRPVGYESSASPPMVEPSQGIFESALPQLHSMSSFPQMANGMSNGNAHGWAAPKTEVQHAQLLHSPTNDMPSGQVINVFEQQHSQNGSVMQVPYANQASSSYVVQDSMAQTSSYPGDQAAMWGASIGFGLGEWASFLTAMQRTDNGINGA